MSKNKDKLMHEVSYTKFQTKMLVYMELKVYNTNLPLNNIFVFLINGDIIMDLKSKGEVCNHIIILLSTNNIITYKNNTHSL